MLKVFQFLIRLFFASGVSILQMRKGTFEIRLSMKTMGKKDKGGEGASVGNSRGERGIWSYIVESDKEGLRSCEN